MPRAAAKSGPIGMTMTKSRMLTNCTAATSRTTARSRCSGVRVAARVRGPGPGGHDRAGEVGDHGFTPRAGVEVAADGDVIARRDCVRDVAGELVALCRPAGDAAREQMYADHPQIVRAGNVDPRPGEPAVSHGGIGPPAAALDRVAADDSVRDLQAGARLARGMAGRAADCVGERLDVR